MDVEYSFVFCIQVNEYIMKKLKTGSSLFIKLAICCSNKKSILGPQQECEALLLKEIINWGLIILKLIHFLHWMAV